MLRFTITATLTLTPLAALADDSPVKPFKEPVYLFSKECKALMVELRGGSLKLMDGDAGVTACAPNGKSPLGLKCVFNDSKQKSIGTSEMSGGITGGEAVITNDGDTFVLNLTSQIFYFETNVSLSNGLIHGKKICSGHFLFESDRKK